MDRDSKILIILLIFSFSAGLTVSTMEKTELDLPDLEQEKPNVILIDIDRLSASRMPCYGYSRNTTPNMCSFGEKNIMFKQATSQSGYTGSSVASIFTSQYPVVHNLTSYRQELPQDRWTMAEILDGQGYRTLAFPSYSGNDKAQLHRGYQLDQGFDIYGMKGAYLEKTNHQSVELMSESEKPFFSFIQGWGPHRYVLYGHDLPDTYSSNISSKLPEISERYSDPNMARVSIYNNSYYLKINETKMIELNESDIKYMQNRYDNSLRQTDRHFGELIEKLKEKGMYDNSIIILTANHGEVLDTKSFATTNRRFGHGKVYEDTYAPLMIRIPEGESATIEHQVQLIDILPTVMNELGLDINETLERRFQGENLQPLYLENRDTSRYRSDLAFSYSHGADQVAIRNSTWKLVLRERLPDELYNLRKDPLQKENVIDEYPDIQDSLESAYEKQKLRNQRLESKIY